MSYVDLMGNERWTEEQHTRRTEAILQGSWPREEIDILNRDFAAVMAGRAQMTPELQARVDSFEGAALAARQAGVTARADAARLHAALDIEEATAAFQAVPPPPAAPEEPDPHAEARLAAMSRMGALIEAASPEVLLLLDERAAWRAAQNPPEAEPEEAEEEPQP